MIKKRNLPQTVQQTLQLRYQEKPQFFDQQAAIAYLGECTDYPIVMCNPLDRAVILCCCLEAVYARYKSAGLPEEIIRSTFSDISLRLDIYQKKHGKVGLSKEDVIWFRHIWNCEMFQIGSLQYQKFPHGLSG